MWRKQGRALMTASFRSVVANICPIASCCCTRLIFRGQLGETAMLRWKSAHVAFAVLLACGCIAMSAVGYQHEKETCASSTACCAESLSSTLCSTVSRMRGSSSKRHILGSRSLPSQPHPTRWMRWLPCVAAV